MSGKVSTSTRAELLAVNVVAMIPSPICDSAAIVNRLGRWLMKGSPITAEMADFICGRSVNGMVLVSPFITWKASGTDE
eukprot:2645333-Alexandrium_andersonii.AAC.1